MKRKLLSSLIVCMIMLAAIFGTAPNMMNTPSINVYAAANYADEDIAGYAYQVAAIVNRERTANGLSPLKFSEELSNAAIVRAQEIQSYFSHTRPNGSSCFTAITERGITYRAAGENIAYGQRNPEAVMNAWMNSSGHRANILNTNMDYIGVGVTYRNGIYYWTQFFAKSDALTGEVITEDSLFGSAPTTTTKSASVTTTAKTPTVTTTKTTAAATTKLTDAAVTTTKTVTAAATKKSSATVTTTKNVTKPEVTTTTAVSDNKNSCGILNLNDILKIIKERFKINIDKIIR